MILGGLRVPLAVQIGVVVVLFAAALGTLWYTSASVVGREERRALANDRLKEASDILEARGQAALSDFRKFSDFMFMEPDDWSRLARRLSAEAVAVRTLYPDVEAGFYLPNRREPSFLPPLPDGDGRTTPGGRNLYDEVDTQVDAAYRKKHELLVVEDVPPDTVAIRTAPVIVEGRVIAATWATTRLVDPIFLDQSVIGYRLFAGLALGGIALSLVLTFNLVGTVRRQAAERDRLQTDLRRSERLAALGKLLAGVAHEVRNPLAGIRSTAQLWRRGIGMDDESLDGLVREVDRLEEIVSRLLQFSRADAQDLAPGDLNAVLAEAARLARGPAEAKGIRVELDLDPGLPPAAMAPPALLQVFRNLTTNALQAMPGGGLLRLATRLDPAQGTVQAVVSDTGPGLPAEVMGHLFEPFFTTKPEGTGLGLAIAREIALAHRGDLRVANRAGGEPGAVFTLVLPAAPVPDVGETV
jgi:two-component system sensor histidine kinase HydH